MTNLSMQPANLPPLDLSSLTAFSRLRRYPGFSSEDLEKILWADFQDWIEKGGEYQTLEENGSITALACLHPLEWDSDHFSIPMFRLQLLGGVHTTTEQYRALTQELLSRPNKSGGKHISMEVDIDNYNALNAVTALGFEVLDLRRTYCTNRIRNDIDFLRMTHCTRLYQKKDYEAVMHLVKNRDFPSRFSRDQYLSSIKVRSMYQQWFHKLLTSPNTIAIVYEKNEEVIACGAVDEVNFKYAGLPHRLGSSSLYAGNKLSAGAYPPVIFRLIEESLHSYGLGEATVSMNNVTVCKILEGFRSYKSAAAAYSLRLYKMK